MKFKIIRLKYGEKEGCHNCDCEVPLAEFPNMKPGKRNSKSRLLCEICSCTHIGVVTDDYTNPDYNTAKMLAQLGNHLLYKLSNDN